MSSENKSNTARLVLRSLLADDGQVVLYRPRWNQMTGSSRATILLQQIHLYWEGAGCQPFYKFSASCDHPLYQQGNSWQEELGMARREFEIARRRIATRTKGELDDNSLVSYWVSGDRLTWYDVNITRLIKELESLDPEYMSQQLADIYQVRSEFATLRPILYAALVTRDGECCQHCGTTDRLSIDHIVAVVHGGGNEVSNLQLLCQSCNSRKGAR